jgi:hypothetical protein
VALIWVGEEAFMESTQVFILASPLISRFFNNFFLGMEMYSAGAVAPQILIVLFFDIFI